MLACQGVVKRFCIMVKIEGNSPRLMRAANLGSVMIVLGEIWTYSAGAGAANLPSLATGLAALVAMASKRCDNFSKVK